MKNITTLSIIFAIIYTLLLIGLYKLCLTYLPNIPTTVGAIAGITLSVSISIFSVYLLIKTTRRS